jgi:hypothetical protein
VSEDGVGGAYSLGGQVRKPARNMVSISAKLVCSIVKMARLWHTNCTVHLALNILRWILGVLLICSVGLKEDSEKKIQSRVESLWLTLAYAQDAALSKVTAFLRVLARASGVILDHVFGARLFSVRGILVSVCFSISSFFLCIQLLSFIPKTPPVSFEIWLLMFAFLFLACVPALLRRSEGRDFWVWWGAFVLFIVLRPLFSFVDFLRKTEASGAATVITARGFTVFAVAIFLFSTASDFCYIALTRWMLRKASETTHWYRIIAIVILDCLLALVLVIGPVVLGGLLIWNELPRDTHGNVVTTAVPKATQLSVFAVALMFSGPALNTIDALACLLFFFLMATMLVHRLFWPVLEGPIYAFQRYGLLNHKGWLVAAGVGLLLGDSIWKILVELATKL